MKILEANILWNHQNAEPTDIEAVVGPRSYPLAEVFPSDESHGNARKN